VLLLFIRTVYHFVHRFVPHSQYCVFLDLYFVSDSCKSFIAFSVLLTYCHVIENLSVSYEQNKWWRWWWWWWLLLNSYFPKIFYSRLIILFKRYPPGSISVSVERKSSSVFLKYYVYLEYRSLRLWRILSLTLARFIAHSSRYAERAIWWKWWWCWWWFF